MSLILNIDTSQETASISVAENGKILNSKTNSNQKDHASFLHQNIQTLLKELSLEIKQLSAVAVSNGPGSYTGLRVGISSAKGLCYALKIPLLAIGSLKIIAHDAINQINEKDAIICPMIDARRMEVFTTLFNYNLEELQEGTAMILNSESFKPVLERKIVYFSGSGSDKFKNVTESKNAFFIEQKDFIQSMSELSFLKYNSNNFDDLVATEPLYLKEYQLFS